MGVKVDFDAEHFDALPVGATIGGYAIQRMLGHGGFGITYEASNRITGKVVAIKEFFPSSLVRRDGQSRLVYSQVNAETIAWALRKFEETTTTLCGLSHPNIVQVLDYVPANDTGYMIMELLDGHTLKEWLKTRAEPPGLDELQPMVDPVMEALVYVHGCGLIHRDIAPDNILITRQGRPVLIDFGSASRDLSDAQQHMLSGTVGLTKRFYTAPEQMLPKARPTPEADIYSMGAVLYRALTGGEPADGQERKDSLFQGDSDPYRPLAHRCPNGCTMRAAEAIDQALALRPDGRLHKMADFREALRVASPATATTSMAAPVNPLPGEPPSLPPPPRSKTPWLTAGAVVLALLVGVFGGRFFSGGGMSGQPRVAQDGPRQPPVDPPPKPEPAPAPVPAAPTLPSQDRARQEPPAPAAVPTAPSAAAPTPAPQAATVPAASPAPVAPAAPVAPVPPAPAPPSPTASPAPTASSSAPSAPSAPKPASATNAAPSRDCPDCPEMVPLAAGEFMMGSGKTPYDRPAHKVAIAKPFAIGRTEVTFAEWAACAADGGCKYQPDDQGFGTGTRPVINVSWLDAKDYLAWLSKKTGKPYRLPSEAEWEYAARGGTNTAYSWGDELGRNKANCVDCGSEGDGRRTLPVRSFAANGFGLYDMAGNAAEWVEDCWNPSYRGAPKDAAPRETGTCTQRVLRGGSFDASAAYAKPTARFRYDADVRYWANGFRVVREQP